ncbi:hypothetical protein JCM6882_000596, partial [Rhodosporidiobolus microsporus]
DTLDQVTSVLDDLQGGGAGDVLPLGDLEDTIAQLTSQLGQLQALVDLLQGVAGGATGDLPVPLPGDLGDLPTTLTNLIETLLSTVTSLLDGLLGGLNLPLPVKRI